MSQQNTLSLPLQLSPRRPRDARDVVSGSKRARSLDDDDVDEDVEAERLYSPSWKRSKVCVPAWWSSESERASLSVKQSVVGGDGNVDGVEYEDYVALNLLSLSRDGALSDVVFVVEGEELFGVRSLFAAQSVVFRRMLFGSMLESVPSTKVILRDITVSAFKYLRSTFYNVFEREGSSSRRSEQLSAAVVVDVLFAAQKYLIGPLVAKCMAFIKGVQSVPDWFQILRDFEASPFERESAVFLEQILSPKSSDDAAYILQFESVQFIESELFERLRPETVAIVIGSDFVAAKEHQIWESLLKWTRSNAPKMVTAAVAVAAAGMDSENEAERSRLCGGGKERDESKGDDVGIESAAASEQKEGDKERGRMDVDRGDASRLSVAEQAVMAEFARFIRFSQMDAAYFREHVVDRQLLPQRDVIEIMFCRENGSKWSSKFNDKARARPRPLDSFRLSQIALSLEEVAALSVRDAVDFRDLYGLFCSATVIETDHSQHRLKMHYKDWGSTYDEWFVYKADADRADAGSRGSERRVVLNQEHLTQRMVRHEAVTGRHCTRQPFKDKVAEFKKRGFRRADAVESGSSSALQVQVRMPMAFWKKNEHFIQGKERYFGRWLSAKIIGFKTAHKYSEHLKVGVYLNGDHFEYWVHPDNAQEIRIKPLCGAARGTEDDIELLD